MTSVRLAILLAVAGITVAPAAARAQGAAAAPAHAASSAQTRMSMSQAVRMVQRRFRARVVRAETRRAAGRTVYVLRLLDRSGRVFTVRVDAASGRIL